jgi:putative alpha-1,2-mannosidase
VVNAPKASRANKYIQSATVNGKPLNEPWFSHDMLTNGGTVTLNLADRPNKGWGSSPDLVSPWSRYAPRPAQGQGEPVGAGVLEPLARRGAARSAPGR